MDAVSSNGMTALMWASVSGRAAVTTQLVEAGADATLRATAGRHEGKTALEMAEAIESWDSEEQKQGKAEVAALLRLGCDPNAPDEYGQTALMLAAFNGHGGVVGALVEHGGAELDAVNMYGKTALMLAAAMGRVALAAQLVEAGADATLRATGILHEGKTALDLAEEPAENLSLIHI